MRRSIFLERDFGHGQSSWQQQRDWNTTSRDYHNHLTRMMRTPSVLPDVVVPHYSSVHCVFEKKAAPSTAAAQGPPPKAAGRKQVRIAEQEKIVIGGQREDCGAEEEWSEEDSVDSDAESFIQQKHKGFELSKWTTFKKAAR